MSTPKLHQNTILLVGTLKPTPMPMLMGAPTDMVPNKPRPMTPYFSQILSTNPGSFLFFRLYFSKLIDQGFYFIA